MDKKLYGRHITEDERARALTQAWAIAKREGARQMLQFGWFKKKHPIPSDWDTSILNDDDGSVTPTYLALQNLIQSW